MTPQAEYTFNVTFTNRRKKKETIDAYTLKQAIAIGKSWSVDNSFKIYDMRGQLVDIYVDGKPLSQQF